MKGYMRSPSLSSEKTTSIILLRIKPAGRIDARKIEIDCNSASFIYRRTPHNSSSIGPIY